MLNELLKQLNIPATEMEKIQKTVKTNPMEAMSTLQKYLSPEMIQMMMQMMMQNPEMMEQAMQQSGISEKEMTLLKGKFK